MKRIWIAILAGGLAFWAAGIRAAGVPEWKDLFNGKDLKGWVNINTAPETLDLTKRSWMVAMAVAMLLLYGAFLERLGFLVCTIGILLVLMKVCGGLGWKLSLLIAVPSVVATYLGFLELGVPLPAGWLARF